jgi:hypothetical protein
MPRCCKPAYHDAAQRANLQPVVQQYNMLQPSTWACPRRARASLDKPPTPTAGCWWPTKTALRWSQAVPYIARKHQRLRLLLHRRPGSLPISACRPTPATSAPGLRRRCGTPAQMWQAWAQSRCRCGRGEPSPGADVGWVSLVPAQMWQGVSPVPAQMWRRCRCTRSNQHSPSAHVRHATLRWLHAAPRQKGKSARPKGLVRAALPVRRPMRRRPS